MQLIDNAHQLMKMGSVQVATVTAGLAIAEQVLPGLQAFLPPGVYAGLMAILVIVRAIKQTKLS
jgi:hypothetical protein